MVRENVHGNVHGLSVGGEFSEVCAFPCAFHVVRPPVHRSTGQPVSRWALWTPSPTLLALASTPLRSGEMLRGLKAGLWRWKGIRR